MKPREAIKPISYLKSNTAELVRTLNECREPIIITQNGEAKAVIQDIASYEQMQETLALLKLLAEGQKDARESGRSRSVALFAIFGKSLLSKLRAQIPGPDRPSGRNGSARNRQLRRYVGFD